MYVYLLIVISYLKFNCCAWVYISKFCHLKIGVEPWTQKMECQVDKLKHFRHILLFEFSRGAKAAEAARNIRAMYGDNAIGESMARKYFLILRRIVLTLVILHVQDDLRCLTKIVYTLIHNDPCQYIRELANVMNCDHSTIARHLHSMGMVQK